MRERPALITEPGIDGAFTRQQAEGAIPNGTRIVKVIGEPGDGNPVGTKGKVIGSIGPIPLDPKIAAMFVSPPDGADYGYWVAWDTMPNSAVFVISRKIRIDP